MVFADRSRILGKKKKKKKKKEMGKILVVGP